MLDLGPFVAEMVKWTLLLGIFAAIIALFRSSGMKGFIGEKAVELAGKLSLDQSEYIQLHNLLLRDTDGSTTQIDHVILTPYGIFVIETKNYKGWIFGSENDAKWTQKLHGKSHTFQNPLRQNYRHIKVLSKLLAIEEGKFKSVVTFLGECTFKTKMPPNVVKGLGYIDYIRSHNTPVLSPETIRKAAETLESVDIGHGREARREHVDNLRAAHKDRSAKSPQKCPKCGGNMVLRTNRKTGEKFWGCTNYPKCRKTLPVRGAYK